MLEHHQRNAFLNGEGHNWLKRNADILGKYDPVSDVIDKLDKPPSSVLEIGCCDGWRLEKLAKRHGCLTQGADPVYNGMTADSLGYVGKKFDLIIFGFCLYVCDPSDYFKIVSESDRVLMEGGHIIIHDNYHDGTPTKDLYSHMEGLYSYRDDWTKYWLVHQHYTLDAKHNGQIGDVIAVLRKDTARAYRSTVHG